MGADDAASLLLRSPPPLVRDAVKPQLPANFEEVTWAKLQDAVNAVHEKRPVATSLEELYRVGVAPPP